MRGNPPLLARALLLHNNVETGREGYSPVTFVWGAAICLAACRASDDLTVNMWAVSRRRMCFGATVVACALGLMAESGTGDAAVAGQSLRRTAMPPQQV